MSQQEEEYEAIFGLDNPHVVKGWQKVNPKNKKPSVPIEKMEIFLKYVFEKSKDELQMDLDEDTNYRQMIDDYLEEKEKGDKKTFTLQEAVEVLNWAVDPGEDEEGEEGEGEGEGEGEQQEVEQQKDKQVTKQKQIKKEQNKRSSTLVKPQSKKEVTSQQIQKQIQHQNHHQQPTSHKEQLQIKQDEVKKLQSQKSNSSGKQVEKIQGTRHSIKQQRRKQSLLKIQPQGQHHMHSESEKKQHKKRESNEHDWGKVDGIDQKNKNVYNEMNSYHPPMSSGAKNKVTIKPPQNLSQTPIQQQNPPKPFKQPLSIKKSLALLNKPKPFLRPKNIPLLKLDPTAPEIRYLRKHKIHFKNKPPKPIYHPQSTGLLQLFKFYCALNSEFYSMNKHKDPAKGTFDQFQNRMTNLYMHNFMLMCKDFNISQNKMTNKPLSKTNRKDPIKENLPQSKTRTNSNAEEPPRKRKSSKGLVPESIQINAQVNKNGVQIEIGQKNKNTQQNLSKIQKQNVKKEIWDRDRLSNCFKKEADYTLNLKYDKFVQLIKTVLKDRVVVEEEKPSEQVSIKQLHTKKQVHQEQNLNETQKQDDEGEEKNEFFENHKKSKQEEQKELKEKKDQKAEQFLKNKVKVEPLILAICKFFNIDTEENYESTMNKLRAQYKVNSPIPVPKTQQQPKKFVYEQQHSHFQQDVNQLLKARELQKEQQRINVKEKYLNKYAAPEHDVYSSFKGATNQVNSLNGLYGSAPKLIPNKQGKCSTVSEGIFGSNNIEYDMRKKNPRDYKMNMSTIIKDARSEIMDTTNKHSNRGKEHLNTQHLSKSRANQIKGSQTSGKQTFGYKKLHDLRQLRQQQQTLSSILLNNSRLLEGGTTSRSQKGIKPKAKDISSPLLQRMGCHEEDDLLNKYFEQEKHMQKHMQKSNVKLGAYLR